jgi:hypothetical protein
VAGDGALRHYGFYDGWGKGAYEMREKRSHAVDRLKVDLLKEKACAINISLQASA